MKWLFAQVILGLGSLSGLSPAATSMDVQMSQTTVQTAQVPYTAIALDGCTMVLARLFPGKQVRSDGTASHPIYLGNDTNSRISSTGHVTPVKTPGIKCQPLTSTLKTKPKLLVTAQQHRNELAAMRQGAPYGAHVRSLQQEANWTHPYEAGLYSWKSTINPSHSRNSSFVSIEEHTQLTTATLMQWDAPCRSVLNEDDMVSIHEDRQSDVEMISVIEQTAQFTEDSSADSAAWG